MCEGDSFYETMTYLRGWHQNDKYFPRDRKFRNNNICTGGDMRIAVCTEGDLRWVIFAQGWHQYKDHQTGKFGAIRKAT